MASVPGNRNLNKRRLRKSTYRVACGRDMEAIEKEYIQGGMWKGYGGD